MKTNPLLPTASDSLWDYFAATVLHGLLISRPPVEGESPISYTKLAAEMADSLCEAKLERLKFQRVKNTITKIPGGY